VVAGRGGTGRSLGLEAPFVGRDDELDLVIELFHSVTRENRARLVSVGGVAGVGKSRLAWEFEKYVDGVAQNVLWHRGRCVAYGEGVTYWALAEMVRMRAHIAEDEDPTAARAKLRDAVERHVADPDERVWVEPPLAHLLGLEAVANPDRQELFAAWRLFFERLSDTDTVTMVFEDAQWADAALLDFIEYLLDWSRNRPLFVLTLARPELLERRPTWGASTRAFTSLFLEPLAVEAMDKLVRGLVPGLPEYLVERIRERADGIPLYAVETVRMLLDRGLITRREGHFVPTADVRDLEVPETLRSLIAARLDGLPPNEQELLRDAAVLGRTFAAKGLAAIGALSEPELVELLQSLARKEFLSVETDPLSPQRGQYGFLQDLVRDVAYQTLSRAERKARHLAVARYVEELVPADEGLVQIMASHLLEAYRLAPDAPDAADVRALAREALQRSGDRAASLGAPEEARRYFERALELTDDPLDAARLTLRAGLAAADAVQADDGIDLLERAVDQLQAAGRVDEAAAGSVQLANLLWNQDRIDDAIERLSVAYDALSTGEPGEALATVGAELGRQLHFRGDAGVARERTDEALRIAETLDLPAVVADALITKELVESGTGDPSTSVEYLRRAVDIAERNQLSAVLLRAYNNLAVSYGQLDQYEATKVTAAKSLALARRLGLRFWEWQALNGLAIAASEQGEWDEALACTAEFPLPSEVPGAMWPYLWGGMSVIPIRVARGQIDEAEAWFGAVEPLVRTSRDVQTRAGAELMESWIRGARGDHARALALAEHSFTVGRPLGSFEPSVRYAFIQMGDSAFALGELDKVRGLVDTVSSIPAAEMFPSLEGQLRRFRARLAAIGERSDEADAAFSAAEETFRSLGSPFWLAVVEVEHVEERSRAGRDDRGSALLAEARSIFERLDAGPWIERADHAGAASHR
jgi:tetratricopeptide (TPR) repeat protein